MLTWAQAKEQIAAKYNQLNWESLLWQKTSMSEIDDYYRQVAELLSNVAVQSDREETVTEAWFEDQPSKDTSKQLLSKPLPFAS